MKLAVGSDERTALTESILAELKAAGHELTIRGPLGDQETRWPEVARQVAESVLSGAVLTTARPHGRVSCADAYCRALRYPSRP